MALSDFPAALIALRDELGLSQLTAAERMGITARTLQRYENGETAPAERRARQFLDRLRTGTSFPVKRQRRDGVAQPIATASRSPTASGDGDGAASGDPFDASHLLVIPDLFGFATLGVPAKNLGGILGVEVRQQLLLPGPRLAKRVMDATLTSLGVFFVLPFLALIALLIKLDSKGPIFYSQNRLGKDGEFFKAYKFRTMHGDGESRLKSILDADPQLRAEYEIYHKLRKDPRVTRIGRVLRKFSLDEFPQLLNVIIGDMSLVGPRPYIEREVTEMGGQEKIILRAPPGMTGMWQVSDRNATSFAQRVQIDVYYVRNWSPWLDIHILAKTFGVVVKGSGV